MKYILLADDGNEYGPFSVIELAELLTENRLVPTSRLRREDGVLTTASIVLDKGRRPSSQHQTYRPPINQTKPVVMETARAETLLNYAPLSKRFWASMLDALIILTAAVVSSYAETLLTTAGNSTSAEILGLLWNIFLPLYWLLSYVFLQGSPGKLALGLRIVSLDGTKPTFGQMFKRLIFCWILCYVPQFIGLFRGPEHRHMGEKWSDTVTISIK